MSTFIVRPSNSEKDAFRIKLTATSMLSLKLKPGYLVLLKGNNNEDSPRPAIAWENSGSGMKDNIVGLSRYLQDLYAFKLGDRISITRSDDLLKDAAVVTLKATDTAMPQEQKAKWQSHLAATLYTKHDIVIPSQKLSVSLDNVTQEFEVTHAEGPLVRVVKDTKVILDGSHDVRLELDFQGVGGLQKQVGIIQRHFRRLSDPKIKKNCSNHIPKHGILLYGAKGTGKTLLKEAIARADWASIVNWSPGAQATPPAYPKLILVDFADIRSDTKAVSELVALFKSIQGMLTLVVGEARHPNDVDERLRTIRTFVTELEIPVPDSIQRLDILNALRAIDAQPSDEQLQDLAARTHGFVGADLAMLAGQVWENALTRSEDEGKTITTQLNGLRITETESTDVRGIEEVPIVINQQDIEHAMTSVRPTALQEVFLEKPSVRWSDIGGQQSLINRLSSAVTRPLDPISRQRMKKLGITITKGILLYGPPGCSKTLLVKALANEASLNFLAVKGAELISMYVGESERATREVFRKARAAAPAIIFFDEIDAIASRGRAGSDLNVLTTLLNEMDGFEELHGVMVVAATNKPQSIDPALLRPGRFDHVVYVGLPDLDTRRDILEKRLRDVSVAQEVRNRLGEYAVTTDGLSGAEMVAVCQTAGEIAFNKNKDIIEVEDIEEAIRVTPRGVTQESLEEYERWNQARLRS